MRIVLLSLYPTGTVARYLVSAYVLAAYIRGRADDVPVESLDVINFSALTESDVIAARVIERKPDIVAASCYSWNVQKHLELAATLRRSLPGLILVWGGPEVAVESIGRYPPSQRADYYVIGEGERKFLSLLRYLTDKETGSPIGAGIASWDGDTLCYRESGDSIEDLDEVPSIYLTETIEERLYARQQAFVETQRGCRFRCKYCVYPKFMPRLTYHSLERVREELTLLIVQKRVQALRFCDAGFTSNLERAKRIARHLLSLKTSGAWSCKWIYWEYNYETVDEEFLDLAARLRSRDDIMNCATIEPLDRPQHYSEQIDGYTAINCIGIQSLNREALEAVGRPAVRADRLTAFLNLARRHNVVLKLDMILGLPFETRQSYFDGLELLLPLLRNTDHVLNIHRLEVLPGSLLEESCARYGIAFSASAPHLATATGWIPEREFRYCCRMTALLFRIVNSPLRPAFYRLADAFQGGCIAALAQVLARFEESPEASGTRIAANDGVDDRYWNDGAFAELPSAWLGATLECLATAKEGVV